MTWISYALAIVILGLAAWLIVRGVKSFLKTGGQSACDHCPYSGSCPGHCGKAKKKS